MLPWSGLPVTVMSSHIDMFGHVNHTRYLEYMEWARFAWAAHLGVPLPELVRDEGIGPAIIRAALSFRRECRLGDELLVTVRVVSARRGIGRLHQDIVDRHTNERVCDAEMAFVMLDLATRKAVPLPAFFLDQLPVRGA
ncbi:MAG: thioesterase family protein [Pseudomonadota bacterium]|nr:thioesterase family protein [Pseudomonadota bacterium]